MILAGLSAIVVVAICTAVMQRQFQDTDNRLGKIFTVLSIYLFFVAFCKPKIPHDGEVKALI